MKQITQPLLFTALFIFAFSVEAQSLVELSSLDKKYQDCLGRGKHMYTCTQDYYLQMDSLLNVAYNKIQGSLDASGKTALKKEHVIWLEKKEVYFKKIDEKYNAEINHLILGNDRRMLIMDEKAEFLRARVEELIKKLGRSEE